MELGSLARGLALISSILLTLTTTPVHSRAKCSGSWATLHACLAGNSGKRSDPRFLASSLPTLADRLRAARKAAIRSTVRSGFLDSLKPAPSFSISDSMLASELAAYLQDDNLPGDKAFEPELQSAEGGEEVDFADNDVADNGEREITPVDMDTVRDIFTALTLQRVLSRQDSSEEGSDTRDHIL